jgi:four helix bundle protein
MKTHKDLDVWKLSISFVQKMYLFTNALPKSEQFGLTNQIRRASVSIASNIAEGAARQSNKEFIHFLYISLGSCAEVDTQLTIIETLHLAQHPTTELLTDLERIMQMLQGLIRSLKNRG